MCKSQKKHFTNGNIFNNTNNLTLKKKKNNDAQYQ